MSGQDWALTTSTARSASNSVTDSPSGNYTNDADAAITMAGTVNLTGATAPVLSWWQKLSLEGTYGGISPYYDRAYFEVSTNGGLAWTQLASNQSTSNSSTWRRGQLDLSTYIGSVLKVRFRLWDNSAGLVTSATAGTSTMSKCEKFLLPSLERGRGGVSPPRPLATSVTASSSAWRAGAWPPTAGTRRCSRPERARILPPTVRGRNT